MLLALCGGCAVLWALGVAPATLAAGGGAFLLGFSGVLLRRAWATPPGLASLRAAGSYADDGLRPLPESTPPIDEISQEKIDAAMGALFDRLPVGLLRIDGDGRVTRSNTLAQDLLHMEAGETVKFESLVDGLGRSVTAWMRTARDNTEVLKPEMVQARRRQGDAVIQVSLLPPPLREEDGLAARGDGGGRVVHRGANPNRLDHLG
ncbi:MAG: hypothetical protein AAF761_11475, partial [Pseudomonadota bacterium]